MTDHASHFFASGNTARGAYSLYESAFSGLDAVLVLSGPSGTGKSTVIRRLAERLLEQGRHVQCFHSPLRPEELDGIIATEWKIGVLDAQASKGMHAYDAREVRIFDFGEALDRGRIGPEAAELNEQLAAEYDRAYEGFAEALRIHDEWERYYIESMDFAKADRIAQELIGQLFAGRGHGAPIRGRRQFFGAATPKGAVDYIPQLTASLSRRIFIKGRPGSGKSTMLKKLAAAAEAQGIDVRIFHCGLDPHSLDMLIFPELGTAIFDSTAPHEYYPDRDGDEILDMYERAMTPGTDEQYADELAAIKRRYSAQMAEATSHLAAAEAIDARIRALHAAATDRSVVDGLHRQLQAIFEDKLR